jgi:Holliday junction resolvase RusA-like endonuclease
MPSDAHQAWHANAVQQCLIIRSRLRQQGVETPLAGLVNIRALFYRDANRGDATGLYESLADLLQDAQILRNDSQIENWDGSRRLVDKIRPRVEVFITVLEERAMQEALPL